MKKRFIFAFLVIACFIVVGCGNNAKENVSSKTEEAMKKIISENNYIIVDVRTKEEYDTKHVVGAINIPYEEINENIALNKTKTIMVYCQSGRRSNIAYKKLKEMNYEVLDLGAFDIINLEKE